MIFYKKNKNKEKINILIKFNKKITLKYLEMIVYP